MRKLYLSHRLDLLVEHLAAEVTGKNYGIFTQQIIMVPNNSLKQWIWIQMATRSQENGIAGFRVLTLQEIIQAYLKPSSFTEIFCALFSALEACQNPEVLSYLKQSPQRIVELTEKLTTLFIRYGYFAPHFFQRDLTPYHAKSWQKQLIQQLFVEGKLRLPLQMTPSSDPFIHCFGCDDLPAVIWSTFNFCSIYLFSPCRQYWEDLCTDRERKSLDRYWKKRGASVENLSELNAYLTDAPPLLANWGKVGRETLKILDSFDLEVEEDYRPQMREQDSSLSRLKQRLLHFQVAQESVKNFPEDCSIQVSKTGSSRLQEIEHLRSSILQLIQDEDLKYSDIAVFAPDIQPYASLVQLVFPDLPIRISGLDMRLKSVFYQGVQRLLELHGNGEDLMPLFENPSFCLARGWSLEALEQIREWENYSEEDLVNQLIYLTPSEENRIPMSAADLLEQFLETRQSLQGDLALLKLSRRLSDWSEFLSSLIQKYFLIHHSDEAETKASTFFTQILQELTQADTEDRLFPFAPILGLFNRSVAGGELHASHLHAIRFSSLTTGSVLPARAIFLIGMEAENFPRRSSMSSLDLLKGEPVYTFESNDQDRYLSLQVLFAAQEFLYISYSHLSSTGHPIHPSSFLEELSCSLDAPLTEKSIPSHQRYINDSKEPSTSLSSLDWPSKPCLKMPEGNWTLSLSDLSTLARHPWEFYCRKNMGIRFERKEEFSYSRHKYKLLRENLQGLETERCSHLPSGIVGEAIKIEVNEIYQKWEKTIQSWDLSIEPVSFKKSSVKKKQIENGWEMPSLELHLGPNFHVKLVGEVKNFSFKGYVHSGNDSLEGLLKVWPECLMALVACEQKNIHCLKSGKTKTVANPEAALKAFVIYYFLAQSSPSPLLPDWADAFLHKRPMELEKKIQEKFLGKFARFEDSIADWVMKRATLPSAETWFEEWQPSLQDVFAELSALYPSRGKNALL